MKKIPRRHIKQQIELLEEELDLDLHEAKHDYFLVKKYFHSSNFLKICLGVAAVGVVVLLRPGKKSVEHQGGAKSKMLKVGRVVETLGVLTSLGKILKS